MFCKINRRIKRILHPVILNCASLLYPQRVIIKGRENLPRKDQQAIFAVNHFNGYDFPMAARVIQNHFYILADFSMQKDLVVNLLNRINGCVYTDRQSKSDRQAAKQKLINLLRDGESVLLFPEGTWNFHPAKLLLPLNWGVIDIARSAKVPIIPIVLLYGETETYANVGKPFWPTEDKGIEIESLKERMSTLLWDVLEKTGVKTHEQFEKEYESYYIKQQLSTYKKLNFAYETSVIRKEHEEPEEVFAHLEKIIPTRNNAFLFRRI